MKLEVVNKNEIEKIIHWRNEKLETLRTPFMLTKEMQEDFYHNVICNRQANARFWFLRGSNNSLNGMGGLVNIEWENRIAEISLIINPDFRANGLGKKAVHLILEQAFMNMNLENVYGECYSCNPAISFWRKVIREYKNTVTTYLPQRKFYKGIYWDSLYFNFSRGGFECRETL